jgi:hypothetical protein
MLYITVPPVLVIVPPRGRIQARVAVIVHNHGEPPIRSRLFKKARAVLISLILRMGLASSLHTAIVFIFPLSDN